ncbi:DUF4267 domain-containing protein [Nonomuraea africana]|uniref:DUF4267 domain-containing protein n=1 Tax=Nonomuraea africana TaxID=46171 RepID=A0ABR9KSI0_9ACTN|nr:DUF4267 domain-containing protein [Nonomuraea africana]MBE1564984.1 hypothetical protein [Nonomuraea africana]
MTRLATALAVLGGLFITYIGVNYLLDPQAIAAGFGLPAVPSDNAFLHVKGVRDLASGLIVFTLLAARQRRALGWTMLAMSFIPFGDAAIVLGHDGTPAQAYLMHGGTAVLVALTGVLLLRTAHARP